MSLPLVSHLFAHILPADWSPDMRWGVTGLVLLMAGVILSHYWRQLQRQRRDLRRSEARFRRFFEEATVAIVEEDFTVLQQRLEALRDHGVRDLWAHLEANPGLGAELFHCVKTTAANRRALAMMDSIDLTDYNERLRRFTAKAAPAAFQEELKALWEGRDEVVIDAAFQGGDRKSHRCVVQWKLSRDQGRSNLKQVLVIFTDLTALHESEERYRQLFEGALEGVYETLPSGALRSANPALARILGLTTPRELLALSPEALAKTYINPTRRHVFFELAKANDLVADFESEIRRPDGVKAWINENVRVVRDGGGQILHFQGFVTDITAHKQAEFALRASEERWRLAVQASAAGIWENNLETGEDFYSDRSREMLGFEPTALAGGRKDWVGRIHPDDIPAGRQAMLDHIAGKVPYYQVEHRFLSKGGTYKWILSRGRAELDPHGRVRRVVGTHVDINERKLAEQHLRESEARYRTLFEHSPIGIVEFDDQSLVHWLNELRLAGVTNLERILQAHPEELAEPMRRMQIIGANAAALRLVGLDKLDDLVTHLPRIFTQEVGEFRRGACLALWSGRHDFEGELTLLATDGSPRRVHAHWWIPVVDGEPQYRRTQLALLDLTGMKSAEQALSAERERLQVTLAAMAEGVVTMDNEGVVRFINDSACVLAGTAAAQAVGRPLGTVCPLAREKTREPLRPPDTAARVADQVVTLPPNTVLVRPDGSARLVEGRCAPMHDQAGQTIGAVLVLHDVTAQSRLELELHHASKLESVGLLAGGIAHDFNNILAVIMGNLTLALMDEQVKTGVAGRWLLEAERGTIRARDLTQQLLTFAKGGEPVRSSVQLAEVVREAAEFALHGSAARCEFSIEPALWPAQVDKVQIGQVVQNLVINAVQAMAHGGVLAVGLHNETVAADTTLPLPPGNYLRLTVHDGGPGISADLLPRIFEPYFTTKETGVGLGLATVYSIVKKHQGHVAVESAPGAGTTFELWLPAAEAPAPATTRSQSPFSEMRGRVLFMDDEEPIRLMATILLTRLGLESEMAEDGAEAVAKFEEARRTGRPFDVVVMDLTVPGGVGGLAALKQLQAIDPAVRAIVSSGYSSDPVMADHRAFGFSGMVAKPYRITDLAKTLREVLNQPA